MTIASPLPLKKHILLKTAEIIAKEGLEAATARRISEKTGAASPQIYRLYKNMSALQDEVARHLWKEHLDARTETGDPARDLYDAVEVLVSFGIKHHEIYTHLCKFRRDLRTDPWREHSEFLKGCIRAVAKAGKLQVSEAQALDHIHPFCTGMIINCLHGTSVPDDVPWIARKAVGSLIRSQHPDLHSDTSALASGLKANLSQVDSLTLGERTLLGELLDRIASAG